MALDTILIPIALAAIACPVVESAITCRVILRSAIAPMILVHLTAWGLPEAIREASHQELIALIGPLAHHAGYL